MSHNRCPPQKGRRGDCFQRAAASGRAGSEGATLRARAHWREFCRLVLSLPASFPGLACSRIV